MKKNVGNLSWMFEFLKVYWQSLSSFRAEPKFFKVAKNAFYKKLFLIHFFAKPKY